MSITLEMPLNPIAATANPVKNSFIINQAARTRVAILSSGVILLSLSLIESN
jgi:hypothetical protein